MFQPVSVQIIITRSNAPYGNSISFFLLTDNNKPNKDMANVNVFNELLTDFVASMSTTYSHIPQMKSAPSKLKLLIQNYPNSPHEEFMKAVQPHVQDVLNRNDEFFEERYKAIPIFDGVDFAESWKQSPPETKTAVWEYMYNLLLLGGSIQNIPDDLMKNIGAFVNSYQKETEGKEELDIAHLMNSLRKDENLSQIFS